MGIFQDVQRGEKKDEENSLNGASTKLKTAASKERLLLTGLNKLYSRSV
jgi:hypothetical protein